MAGWHHWLDGRESEWTLGVGDGQGGLGCCDLWARKELDTTEWLNWTEPFHLWYFFKYWDLIALEFSYSILSLRSHGLQHAKLPCPSPSPRDWSNSCLLNWWCHPTISSSVAPFSSYPQSFTASGAFPTSPFFASGGQSVGVSASASVLPMNIQDWFPLGLTGLISLLSKGLKSLL